MTLITSTIPAPEAPHFRLSGAMRSEWTKIRSVRSTTWTIVATVVLTIGIGIIGTATEAGRWASAGPLEHLAFDPTSLSLTGLLLGQLAIGILGILAISAEYGTGTIRSSLAAIPNRPMFLAAKAGVFAALALVVGEIVSFGAFFTGQMLIGGGAPHATLGQAGVLQAVAGGGLYLALLGVFAMGLGFIIRHTAGAIAAFVGVLLILPLLTPALPQSFQHIISKFEPATIGNAMTSVNHQLHGLTTSAFSPWIGMAILAGYAAVALGVGGWRLARRDA
jgi:ABC-2 type transport system permease protein